MCCFRHFHFRLFSPWWCLHFDYWLMSFIDIFVMDTPLRQRVTFSRLSLSSFDAFSIIISIIFFDISFIIDDISFVVFDASDADIFSIISSFVFRHYFLSRCCIFFFIIFFSFHHFHFTPWWVVREEILSRTFSSTFHVRCSWNIISFLLSFTPITPMSFITM